MQQTPEEECMVEQLKHWDKNNIYEETYLKESKCKQNLEFENVILLHLIRTLKVESNDFRSTVSSSSVSFYLNKEVAMNL